MQNPLQSNWQLGFDASLPPRGLLSQMHLRWNRRGAMPFDMLWNMFPEVAALNSGICSVCSAARRACCVGDGAARYIIPVLRERPDARGGVHRWARGLWRASPAATGADVVSPASRRGQDKRLFYKGVRTNGCFIEVP